MKKVKQINIVFENCEVACIPIKDIYTWGAYDLSNLISACNINESHEVCVSNHVLIIFNDLENLNFVSTMTEDYKSLMERLTTYKDVTHINIIHEDGTSNYISVPWGSKDDFYNAFQEFKKTKYKNTDKQLYILSFENKWTLLKLLKYIKHLLSFMIYKIKRKFLQIKKIGGYSS